MISQLFFKKGLYSSCSWIARSLGLFRQPGFLAGFAFMECNLIALLLFSIVRSKGPPGSALSLGWALIGYI